MDPKNILKHLQHYLILAIRIQIFATLVSLAILTYWGLPSSLLTVLGNLIFTPILTLFLLLSSGIFFLELLHLPNQGLISALEWLTEHWLKIIPTLSHQYLIAFPKITWWIFALGLLLGLVAMTLFKLNRTQQTILLGGFLFSCAAISKLPFWRRQTPLTLTYRRKTITITPENGYLMAQDSGTLNFASGSASWIQYTLIPAIIGEFGTLQINHLQIGPSSKSTCKNLTLLQKTITINEITQKTSTKLLNLTN